MTTAKARGASARARNTQPPTATPYQGPATQATLERIHALVTAEVLRQLEDAGKPGAPPLPPAQLNVITGLLKLNGIVAQADSDTAAALQRVSGGPVPFPVAHQR
jgi:hypothetical protein